MSRSRSLEGRSVLVVEDTYFIADEMCRAFEENGARVVGPVSSVDDALALLSDGPRIDGAVLDIKLHETMVYPVADLLRQRGVPFVFATGYESADIPEHLRGVAHCEKPVEAARVAGLLFGAAAAG